jgi:excisionase family DNA binding protein
MPYRGGPYFFTEPAMAMPRAKPKSIVNPNRPGNGVAPAAAGLPDVLTLSEAAAYLRVAEADVLRLARQQELPSRLIGTEWRFLKSALQSWLGASQAKTGKTALLALAGAFKDDPYLDDIVQEAYRKRGRPVTEDEA